MLKHSESVRWYVDGKAEGIAWCEVIGKVKSPVKITQSRFPLDLPTVDNWERAGVLACPLVYARQLREVLWGEK
jgi:hypothetical protein